MKANKKLRKQLRAAAGVLHKEAPKTYVWIKREPIYYEHGQKLLIPLEKRTEVERSVNHYLRMKRAFKRGGLEAVNNYIRKVTPDIKWELPE